jgi:hypothetical protein
MKIGLVSCSKSKLDRPAPARELYSPSTGFRGRRTFVERSCDRWFILSAKHGVVDPDDVLEPYDQTLVGAPIATKREWAARVLRELEMKLGPLSGIPFEIHAGRDYWGFGLVDGLESRGAPVVIPTKGLSQGRQLAFYAKAST